MSSGVRRGSARWSACRRLHWREHCPRCFCLRIWEFSGSCGRPVHGCTRDRPRGIAGARTYGVQPARHEHHPASFAQVTGHMEVQAGAYCKTVGSAYVGSNPTPATRFRRSEPVTPDCVTGFSRTKGAPPQEGFLVPRATDRSLASLLQPASPRAGRGTWPPGLLPADQQGSPGAYSVLRGCRLPAVIVVLAAGLCGQQVQELLPVGARGWRGLVV